MDFSRFFIDRPIFAAVLSILIFITGLIAIPLLPVSERGVSGRQPESDCRDRGDAAGRGDQRR